MRTTVINAVMAATEGSRHPHDYWPCIWMKIYTGHQVHGVPSGKGVKADAERRHKTIGDTILRGHLATITSREENNCVLQNVIQRRWVGASDATNEGNWRWMAGPEGETDDGLGRFFWADYYLALEVMLIACFKGI